MTRIDDPNELDDAIRTAIREVVSGAPLPPDLGSYVADDGVRVHRLAPAPARRPPRRTGVLAVAAAACVLLSVLLIVGRDVSDHGGTDPGGTPPGPTSTADHPWPSGEPTILHPTLVEPTQLPAGWDRSAAGRVGWSSGYPDPQLGRVVAWEEASRATIELTWVERACPPTPGPGSVFNLSDASRLQIADAFEGRTTEMSAGAWCEGRLLFELDAANMPGPVIARLLRRLQPTGDPAAPFVVDLPAGWRHAYTPGAPARAAIRYTTGIGGGVGVSVRIEGAGPAGIDVPVMSVDSMDARATGIRIVGGRRALVSRTRGAGVVRTAYDDRTVVTIWFGDATDEELDALVSSLAPAGMDRFPDVEGDSAACDRVGLCG